MSILAHGCSYTIIINCAFSFTENDDAAPFIWYFAIVITVGLIVIALPFACVIICCIICCVHKPSRMKLKDFCNEKDCENCYECTRTLACCLAGVLLWIVLLPISCPYFLITTTWNGINDAKKGDGCYCEPLPCCKDCPCHPDNP